MSPRGGRLAWGAATLAVAALFAFPLLVMLAGSLREPGLPPPRTLELLPSPATADAYRDAFALVPLARALVVSFAIAAVYTPLAVIVASWAGFAIAQAPARARRALLGGVVAILVVPVTAMWIPRFLIFESLGLVGTYAPLLATALLGGGPFLVLLYAFAFLRQPPEIADAARLEGAGPLRVWRTVAMPLARRTTVAVAMLAFVASWSNFVDPLLYLNRPGTYTAPLVLRFLEQLGSTNWPVLLAGSVAVTAPVVGLFLATQRAFLSDAADARWAGR